MRLIQGPAEHVGSASLKAGGSRRDGVSNSREKPVQAPPLVTQPPEAWLRRPAKSH